MLLLGEFDLVYKSKSYVRKFFYGAFRKKIQKSTLFVFFCLTVSIIQKITDDFLWKTIMMLSDN
jgi:hypothetical protein